MGLVRKVAKLYFSLWRRWAALVLMLFLGLFSWQVAGQILLSEPKKIPNNEVYLQPVPGLSYAQLRLFKEGEKEFKVPWVVFPLLGGIGV
jgi:hypothetical protein